MSCSRMPGNLVEGSAMLMRFITQIRQRVISKRLECAFLKKVATGICATEKPFGHLQQRSNAS